MDDVTWTIGVLATMAAIYFAPTMAASHRKVPNFWPVAVVNTFLGWTLVGWVVALAMAVRDKPKPAGAAAPVPAGEVARLRELGDLHAQGVLTDDEFAAAKQRVLRT